MLDQDQHEGAATFLFAERHSAPGPGEHDEGNRSNAVWLT
jgi:hypothetical protein